MKAIVADRYGPPEVAELRDVDEPVPGDDQVLIRVRASSVNPADWYRVAGPWFTRPSSGLLKPRQTKVGTDLAGRVEAVGSGITEFQPGDEVFGTTVGAWAECAPAREVRLVRKPDNLSFEEAAGVPVAAITALQALRDHGRVQPGQKVLINGAAGGVGTFAVQLAKRFGADVTAVCSAGNVELVNSLGADRVVDYSREDFTKLGERHDVMLDIAGTRSFSEFRRVLTPEAIAVVVGAPMSARGLGPLSHVIRTRLGSVGRSQTVKFFVAQITKEDLGVLQEHLAAGEVRSVVDRSYALADVQDALRYLGTRHARAKVIITV